MDAVSAFGNGPLTFFHKQPEKRSNMLRFTLKLAAIVLYLARVSAFATIIVSNNSPLNDTFTNSSPFNQGQAVGTTNWYYNNVRHGGTVGISNDFPNTTTGSVYFSSPSISGKADIEYLVNAANIGGNYLAGGALGLFADLQSFTFQWYRKSTSTVPGHLHPALRVLLDADGNLATVTDRGGLVFERVYNSLPIPFDAWTTDTVTLSTYLWNFGLGLGFAANINSTPYAYDATLAEWQAYFPNAVILGFSAGVGSGWNGVFEGAVDLIGWTLGSQTSLYNFEVVRAEEIPEPGSLMLTGLGAVLLLARRVGRKKARN